MSRIKTVLVCCLLTLYVGSLSFGVIAHALKVGLCGNTLSYFVVWDMFCGWTAWDVRTHLIAESTSGKYYEVKEPWGEFHPFGHIARIHYDHTNHLLPRHVRNILRHSSHDPVSRVYVIEEIWPKQYNLPPDLYAECFNRPNDCMPYYHRRAICAADGSPLATYPDWHAQQMLNAVCANPRMRLQAQNASASYSTLYTPRGGLEGKSFGPTVPESDLSTDTLINTN